MRIGEPSFNAERTVALARQADEDQAALIAFPELGLSGYSIDDLLHQGALLDGVARSDRPSRGRDRRSSSRSSSSERRCAPSTACSTVRW